MLGRFSVPSVNLIRRDVSVYFENAVNVDSRKSKIARHSGELEGLRKSRNHNFEPSSLVGRFSRFSGRNKRSPRGLESIGVVRGKCERTARILQTRNINFVTVTAFYPLPLAVSRKFSISFQLGIAPRCRGLVGRLYLFTPYALPLTYNRVSLRFGLACLSV